MRRRTPCERCGTRRFKKKSDGTMVCKNGHVLVGWVEETQDDDMVYMGKKLSRPKALKSVGHEQTRYTGIDRESAILQVCQNGLNVLIQYCVREFGFPDNIQKIAQDLWELYIIATGKMVTFDIFDQGEEDQRGPEDQQQQNHMSTENVLKLTPMPSKTLEDELGVDLDDDDNDVLHNHKNDKENKEEGTYEWPELRYAHTIIFLFLTFKWARLPVLFSDIRRWCKSLQLPYMDALYQIPDDIVRHLDRAFIYTLKYIPNMRSLYRDLRRFRICFEQECGVKFSNENIPAIVHRLYPHFGLPDTFRSHASMILQKMQDTLTTNYDYYPIHDTHDDIIAVVCMIIVVKVLYYLDDRPEGKRNRPSFPTVPPKDSVIQKIQSSTTRCKTFKQETVTNADSSQASRFAFLQGLTHMLRAAGFQSKEMVTLNKGAPMITLNRHVNDRYNVIYLPPAQIQDLGVLNHLDITNAESQIRSSASVYNMMKPFLPSNPPPKLTKEYQALLELASCLIDMDIKFIQAALSKYEYLLRDLIG